MAAEVLLARSEISDDDIEWIVSGKNNKKKDDGRAIGKGVINGGLTQVGIVGVWGDGDEVCKTLLIDALLQCPGSGAAVVDATGEFDVVGLYTSMLERLKKDPKALGEKETEDVAASMLERVKIMRVFDFVGVREAVGEIRDGLEGRRERMGTPKHEPLTPEVQKRTVVADSEDEDEEEEMLFDIVPPLPAPASESTKQPQSHPQPQLEPLRQDAPQGRIKFILLSSLTRVLTPLLKKDSIQAYALITPFLTSLAHLTRTHALHTILANPAPLPPARTAPDQQQSPPTPSIFASNSVVPSLMGVLARYVDLGILVSALPRGKMDARVVYRYGGVGMGVGVKKAQGVECVSVIEVLGERWEGRVGAWEVLKAGG